MKLFNVITVHDIYVLATDHDDARAAANVVIATGDQAPYDQVAYEINDEKKIRNDWRGEPPWVSENLPDYNPKETESCAQAFARIYSKR